MRRRHIMTYMTHNKVCMCDGASYICNVLKCIARIDMND